MIIHNPNSYACTCHACWQADVDDQASRVRKEEDAIIAKAAEIIRQRKENRKRGSDDTR